MPWPLVSSGPAQRFEVGPRGHQRGVGIFWVVCPASPGLWPQLLGAPLATDRLLLLLAKARSLHQRPQPMANLEGVKTIRKLAEGAVGEVYLANMPRVA